MPHEEPMKALVLDFGGVISKTLFETHSNTERALGLVPGQLTWKGPFAPETDPLWVSMQADEISERDYWLTRSKETGSLVGQDWTKMSDLLIAARGDVPNEVIRPEFLETLARTKDAGCLVAILSNELDLFYGTEFRKKLTFLPQIDVIHDATYTKTLKPVREAYHNLIADFDLRADQCVFVDDQMRNVVGARAVGMATVHFDVLNPQQSYAEAERLLGLHERIEK
ncbi:HAD-IA family hydrolase [Yoonia sp. SS1-5]|uniref:HAD-IA family hydrolase n=1 Tax=Yoonia rhodophyticola TaxID=3137370 RepID=A0AAN0NGW2_9RHOB